MRTPILEALQQGALLADGAMGTELYQRGFFLNRCYDELNLSAAPTVLEIHRAYAQAGAELLETNTFGANRVKLGPHGFAEQLETINRRGAELAREAAGEGRYVAGVLGPLGVRIEPWGPTSNDEARAWFAEQARALAADGLLDLLILETFTDLSELRQALHGVRDVCALPVLASMTIDDHGASLYGTATEVFTERLDAWGADLLGLNCSVGPAPMLDALEKMRQVTDRPCSVMPNAGAPRMVEGRNLYLATAEYMAEFAKRFLQAGAAIVGGCCGTTPAHIKAMQGSVRMLNPQTVVRRTSERIEVKARPAEPPPDQTPTAEKSRFARLLFERRFPVSVELTPPRGWDPAKLIAAARTLAARGVDAVNVPDGPRASCRMSNSALCLLIAAQVDIETIPHYCCRDRNLLGMMSDILGLAAQGLKNLLIITGDPPKMGDYPDATAVFDVDAIGLTNLVNRLNRGLDPGGNAIKPPTRWHIGVGVNPAALDLDHEIRRFEWKVKAGAEFAITQPVFDPQKLLDFLPRIAHVRVPILAGVWPLTSYRNALFMNSEVPGASVPEPLMERMRTAGERSKDAALKEGLAIAREAALQIAPAVEGLQVSAPFGRIELALEVIDALGGRGRA